MANNNLFNKMIVLHLNITNIYVDNNITNFFFFIQFRRESWNVTIERTTKKLNTKIAYKIISTKHMHNNRNGFELN